VPPRGDASWFGLISAWLDEAAEAGVTVPTELSDAFRQIRWTNAIQAGRVLACVKDVRDALDATAIPHIFLKGGARLAADEPGADLQYSGDVDVLVPNDLADLALAALRGASCLEVRSKSELAQYASSHQREPQVSPHVGLPVEVHVSLSPAPIVSQPLDYAALEPSSRRICGPVGEICTLDQVASAVHLAYHARDLGVWRDIVLLARSLCGFDRAARARFDDFVKAEKRDRIRLASAVAAADAVAFEGTRPAPEVRRYLAWAQLREDLPRRFAHTLIVEGIIGRCPIPELQIDRTRPDVPKWLRIWARNLVLLPSLGRSMRQHRAQLRRRDLAQ
jgi:hypothetical protein